MVSVRSDDIRGRWGRLIDNTASFTDLDLSGQASSIVFAISGQVLASNISGQVSGFSIGPSTVVAGSATFSQVTVQSGITTQQISGSSLNLQSGIVAGTVTISGTTTLQGITTIGANASGISFSGLQMLPTMGPSQTVVWVSGSTYRAMSTQNGIIIASGTDAVSVINTAITTAAGGAVWIKKGTYTMLSGITLVTAGARIIGEGRTSKLDFQPTAGFVSGCIRLTGFDQAVMDLWINVGSGGGHGIVIVANAQRHIIVHNMIFGPGEDHSGKAGIFADNTIFSTYHSKITHNTFLSWDRCMWFVSGSNAQNIGFCDFGSFNTGLELDNTSQCMVTNLFGQTASSGVVILKKMSAHNTISNIIGESNTAPTVTLETSSALNRITNVQNTGSAQKILDLTNSANFLLPGALFGPAIASGASPYTYINISGCVQIAHVNGGTVSQIDIKRATTTATISGATAGTFILSPQDKLIITYSAVPTINILAMG